MKRRYNLFFSLVCFMFGVCASGLQAQNSYSDFDQLTERLQQLASEHDDLTNLNSLTQSPGGREVWVLTIGNGDINSKPAITVIGGANGSHILGSELALQFSENLLSQANTDSIQTLLKGTTFYVMPRINPDATEQYFAKIRYERGGNATETDDDRDGNINEDAYEDLNGDGLITMMRITSKTGDQMTHEDDQRIMVKSDPQRSEQQRYRMFTEGRDNDNDETFNEDGTGGVNINKNFTFDYPYFQPGAGENMASQPETRAIMDFLFDKGWNVFAVVSFGPENNLSEPLNYNSGAASKRVVSSWLEDDISTNKVVSDLYNSTIILNDAPDGPPQQGDLFQWAYYHYGRLSFSTPGWWTPPLMDKKGKPKKFGNGDAHYLAWADNQNVDAFVDWQQVNHPDFPNQTVEVGGIKPFVKSTPPYTAVDSIAEQHTDFLIKLAQMHPQIELTNFKTEKVGDGLSRISVDIYNAGQLPTTSQLGTRTRWVRGVNVELKLSDDLSIISGRSYQSFDRIKANESKTISWLVQGDGSYTIKAGAPTAGFSTIEKTIR